MPGLSVLVVDDERLARMTTLRQLTDAGFRAEAVDSAHRAIERLGAAQWDVVVTDIRMHGMDGLQLLRRIRTERPDIAVILMTAYATVETAVTAMREGAADYLTKPFPFEELEYRLQRVGALCSARKEIRTLREKLSERGSSSRIVGRSAAMRRVRELCELYAPHTAPVLITGHTGTGKEVVARALHEQSPRASGPFVPVPCGAIPATLAESELFGHERGAFTGAVGRRQGAFERAHGGTVLLDDLDDLPLDVQAKLLRVLQEGTFTRVGGSREIQADFRTVATTKADLDVAVGEGRFRSDLYYRLRALEIRLPSLAERPDDILPLTEHFLQVDATPARPAPSLTPEALAALQAHDWPGNVRELRHALEAAGTLCGGKAILLDHLPQFLRFVRERRDEPQPFTLHIEGLETLSMPDVVRSFEAEIIDWALSRTGGSQTAAATILGVPRTTFQSKLRRPKEGE